MQRLQYHFEPKVGWINDPNGLCYFKGKYHAFFQHNPYEAKHGPMHWGHAVSEDLITWEELPIAIYPDQPYENTGGCFSGSAVVKDDVLYLFYTSVSKELGQTQSLAISYDGVHFEKYAGNPIISVSPVDPASKDFRDPKVGKHGDAYYMVVGAGVDGIGKLLLYTSQDLYNWQYEGIMLEGEEYGPVVECPDLFPLGNKYVLMFSKMKVPTHATKFWVGDFDGTTFTMESEQIVEAGPSFYAPQTFLDHKGRRIIIAWMYSWGTPVPEGATYVGAFTIPREVLLEENVLKLYPIKEAWPLLQDAAEQVVLEEDMIRLYDGEKLIHEERVGQVEEMKILKDTQSIEVFLNGGEKTFSFWYDMP
jgi:sucrose-6-phosphate hydrolase SacC (GH32 family)